MGSGTLARRSWATMVTMLGLPRLCGIVDGDLLEVEVPLDADGQSIQVARASSQGVQL